MNKENPQIQTRLIKVPWRWWLQSVNIFVYIEIQKDKGKKKGCLASK